jgi:hypothetical protein
MVEQHTEDSGAGRGPAGGHTGVHCSGSSRSCQVTPGHRSVEALLELLLSCKAVDPDRLSPRESSQDRRSLARGDAEGLAASLRQSSRRTRRELTFESGLKAGLHSGHSPVGQARGGPAGV